MPLLVMYMLAGQAAFGTARPTRPTVDLVAQLTSVLHIPSFGHTGFGHTGSGLLLCKVSGMHLIGWG